MIIIEMKRDGEDEPVVQLCEAALGCRFLLAEITHADLRSIVAWVNANHPEIIQDIVCEDCPEVC